jgi:histidinol-phosphate aminotransferase
LYTFLVSQKIVVRNRSNQPLCDNCLRITVGTPAENEILIAALKKYPA